MMALPRVAHRATGTTLSRAVALYHGSVTRAGARAVVLMR